LALEQQMDSALARSYAAHESLKGLRTQLAALKTEFSTDADLQKQVMDLDAKAAKLADTAPGHTSLAAINGAIVSLVNEVDDGDRSPPAQYHKSFDDYHKALDAALESWDELRLQDLAALNAALTAKGHTEVEMGAP
jgi:frataxin-like iron-binding protein CyaY